ncbi:MAG: hypothetical protein M1542_00715 [Thermotogae bacterium]|jgi:hypothetical protein|nr:hypothetical protein [Thermotogota bacterium]MCL5031759.1 hypothetical protein [Thermotogota bacterium]
MLKAFVLILSAFLACFVMAEGVVRSVGSGPAFEISPAIVFTGENGDFQIGGFSGDGMPITLEVYFNGKVRKFFDRQWTFNSTLPSTSLYSYVTFKSENGYLTSVATALVVSYKIMTNIENGIGIFNLPDYGNYLKGTEKIFAIVPPGYGRENVQITMDNQTILDQPISVSDNSPKIFEANVNTQMFEDGFHTLFVKANLITGESLLAQKKVGIDNNGPKVVSFSGSELFLSGKYSITVAATDLIGLKDAELYVKNADNTLIFMGKNDFLNGNVNFVIGDFTGSRTFVVKLTNVVGFSSNYEFTITNNQSLIMPLIVLTVAIGVILLTFIK